MNKVQLRIMREHRTIDPEKRLCDIIDTLTIMGESAEIGQDKAIMLIMADALTTIDSRLTNLEED